MPTTAGFLAYVVELFAPWGPVVTKRMFGGAGIYRDGRMFGLIADDQIFLKVNPETRAAFEAQGSKPFVFVSKAGEGTAMSYWSLPPAALDDTDVLIAWADRAWAATGKAKPAAKPARKGPISARELADLPLKMGRKGGHPVKKR
jgi:DNA transformation protein